MSSLHGHCRFAELRNEHEAQGHALSLQIGVVSARLGSNSRVISSARAHLLLSSGDVRQLRASQQCCNGRAD